MNSPLCRGCALVRRLSGWALAIGMGAIFAGSWLAPESVRRHTPLLAELGINTAISLALAGMALLLPAWRRGLGWLIAAIGGAVVLQYQLMWAPPDGFWRLALNVRGEDLPWAGHMAPFTALSVLCAGLALALLEKPRQMLGLLMLQLAPGLILAAVVGGALNRALNGLLFMSSAEGYAVMSVAAMAALIVFVAGYLAAMAESAWFHGFYAKREERQAFAIGLIGLTAALLLGGATVIGMLGSQMQELMEKKLAASARAEASALHQVLSSALDGLQAQAGDAAHGEALLAGLRNLAGAGGAVWVEGADGSGRPGAASPFGAAPLRVRINGAAEAWLSWDRAWRLEARLPTADGRGMLLIRKPLPELEGLFAASMENAASSAESGLCGHAGAAQPSCFSFAHLPHALAAPAHCNDLPTPMWRALEGRRSIAISPDCRGVMSVAAYSPVGDTGLGMVRRIDAGQMYGPLRAAVWRAILFMFGIGLLAMGLIYLRVRRLVRHSLETGRHLRGVLDALPVGVWITDRRGRIVMNNPAGSRIWAGERWVGVEQYGEYKGWRHDSGEPVGAHDWGLARAVERGETSIDEIVDIECFDGTRKTISYSALPLRDEHGGLLGGIMVNQDITERVRAETALNASRDLFRSVVENAPIRVFWKDVEMRYLGGNSLFARDAGMARAEDLVGKDDFQMSWREQAHLYRADDQQVMRSGVPKIAYEEQQTTPDGRVIWVRTSKVPLRGADGKVFGVLGIYDDITEAKYASEALQRSQKNLIEAQRIGRMGSWELDLVHDKLSWSDEIFQIFELDPKRFEASYTDFLNAVHPDDRAGVNEAYTESLKCRTPYKIEHRLLMPDGRIKHVYECGETAYDGNGRPVLSIGTVQDITERKASEAEIRRLAREFRSLAENLPDMVSRFDRGLRFVYVNPEGERSIGVAGDALLGRTYLELGAPDGMVNTWHGALHRVFHSGEPEVFECRFPSPGGIVKDYQVRAVPEFDADGSVATVLTVARDVSTLKGAQEVLRESEERFQAMASNVPGMVFQCYRLDGDRQLRFVYVSGGVEYLLGTDGTTIQMDANEFIDRIVEEDAAAFSDSLDRSQSEQCLWNWEGRVAMHDGEIKWLSLRATPRRYGADVCMWDGVAVNVTESKANVEQLLLTQTLLRDLSAHLEHVREQERKAIAREIHDELGQTLTALRMDVSLARLSFGQANPELTAHLQSMTQLVDRTIEIARHVTASLRPAALDLGIVAALEWLLEEFIGHAGIPCELVLGDGELNLDEPAATAVFRIVQESLTNIARHAEATQAEVIVTLASEAICFEVNDNGKGFDPQAEVKRNSFGLVGMRERVAMLQGELRIDSEPGQGTRVRVCIPV